MNMHKWILATGLLAAIVLISACGHKNMVILVPDPNGSVGKITIANASGSVDIDTANQATVIKNRESAPSVPATVTEKKIQALFGEALAIQPPPPVHFILYFKAKSTQLMPESIGMLQVITDLIQQQHAERITVVGHSDTKGEKADNLKLSMHRAIEIKKQLVEKGVAESHIEVTSHGEENPLVKTADNVGNAKNRRVEIVIR